MTTIVDVKHNIETYVNKRKTRFNSQLITKETFKTNFSSCKNLPWVQHFDYFRLRLRSTQSKRYLPQQEHPTKKQNARTN